MSQPPRVFQHLWIFVLIAACCFLFWCDRGRVRRVREVSDMIGGAAAAELIDPRSSTGYANDQRELIVPGRNERSFDWIAQTQQMAARHEGRVRHVVYDNAPQGRSVNSPSPYRWWLGLTAWTDRLISGCPIGLAVEHAALWADPALHGLLLIGGTLFVAWRLGGFAAALFSIGMAAIFPFAGDFLPGAPDDRGLSHVFVIGSLLTLLVGLFVAGGEVPGGREKNGGKISSSVPKSRWFAVAGIIGGVGLWIDVSAQVPVIAGIFLGGVLAALTMRWSQPESAGDEAGALPWRVWSLAGGGTVLAGYLIEYFPAHFESWRLEFIHPLYGLAWIGLGEFLGRLTVRIRREKSFSPNGGDWVAMVVSIAAVAAIPLVMWKTGGRAFLVRDLSSVRLTLLPDGAVAASFFGWASREGMSVAVWATVLPLLVLIPAVWLLFRSATNRRTRLATAVMLGPVLILLGFASQQLANWNGLDGALFVLLSGIVARQAGPVSKVRLGVWSGCAAVMAIFGMTRLLPPGVPGSGVALTAAESQELIERHLAQWLARLAVEPRAVVYAPPHLTATLGFYGGLRGIGTFAEENKTGFGAALMIAAAKTMEEAQGLLQARTVRYIVIPSWDPFFEDFAQRYLVKSYANRTSMLAQELRQWNLPPWLRAIPYQLPVGGGFEGQSVLIFEVIDEQSPAVAASRLAEYLVEIGQLDRAGSTAETLRRFPGDVGALVARAQVQAAREDTGGFEQTLAALQARLTNNADRFLPWDRRVSLAVVLARGNKVELAREQMKRCVAEADEKKLRALTTGSLYGFEVLAKAFDLKPADPVLDELARSLLPPDLRERL